MMIKRLAALWSVVKGDGRRLLFALRHPAAPAWLKGGAALLVLYVVSPVDLIPDALPVIGIVDDLVLVPAVIRLLLSQLPAALRADVERRATGR